MASGSVAAIAAGACFLVAALACARSEEAGKWLGAAGATILAGALAARGLQAGHWPLISQYEFALAYALGTALAALFVGWRRDNQALRQCSGQAPTVRAATMALAATLITYARLGVPPFKREIQPLPPALDSVWLPLHVGAAALGYGALTMAGVAGVVWLLHKSKRGESRGDQSERLEVERLLDRAIAAGYPLVTLCMLLGVVWAQGAWGRYWGWDLKEVWTLITWLIYTLYWHLRRRTRRQGRWMAWLALIGLGSVLFTFLGVGWLARKVGLESLHLF